MEPIDARLTKHAGFQHSIKTRTHTHTHTQVEINLFFKRVDRPLRQKFEGPHGTLRAKNVSEYKKVGRLNDELAMNYGS